MNRIFNIYIDSMFVSSQNEYQRIGKTFLIEQLSEVVQDARRQDLKKFEIQCHVDFSDIGEDWKVARYTMEVDTFGEMKIKHSGTGGLFSNKEYGLICQFIKETLWE